MEVEVNVDLESEVGVHMGISMHQLACPVPLRAQRVPLWRLVLHGSSSLQRARVRV